MGTPGGVKLKKGPSLWWILEGLTLGIIAAVLSMITVVDSNIKVTLDGGALRIESRGVRYINPPGGIFVCFDLADDEQTVATGDSHGFVRLWQVGGGDQVKAAHFGGWIKDVQLDEIGQKVYAMDGRNQPCVLDLETGERVKFIHDW